MLTPSILSNWMDMDTDWLAPMKAFRPFAAENQRIMSTDIKETDEGYELDIELPGFKKEEINLQLKDGYLKVSAAKAENKEEKKNGHVIRQERYSGAMQRQFFVGEHLTEDDIKAKFEHGILSVNVPKKEAKIEQAKYIAIEG